MATQQNVETGTRDVTYNLISFLYHALQGAENYEIYAKDAEQAGKTELARFFREMSDQASRNAEQAKQLLAGQLGNASGR